MNTIRSNEELCNYVKRKSVPKMVLFWGHQAPRDGAMTKACFSQWFPAPFSIGGITYPTAEHYMMAAKARLFRDDAALAKVLAAPSPSAAKAAGRQVRGFDEATWVAHRWDIVVTANVEKFGQNPALREYLLGTGERILVEASPVDKIWGTGIAIDDPRAEKPLEWKGLNLLGYALMEVRARLA